MRRSGSAASSRPTLGGLGSSSSLITRHAGARWAMVDQQLDAHVDAAAGRMVLDHDRQRRSRRPPRGSGRGPPRRSGWARAGGASITECAPIACASRAKATAPVGGRVDHADADRQVAGRRRSPRRHLASFVVAELAGLAEHARGWSCRRRRSRATNAVRPGRLASSSEPSGANGVGHDVPDAAQALVGGHRVSGRPVRGPCRRSPATGSTRPIATSHRPGPLVRTWAGSSNWNAPIERRARTTRDAEPDPARRAVRIRNDSQRSIAERPVARRVRQGDQRERRDADEEDQDAAARRTRCRRWP